jgi:hypothetical protein
MEADVKGDIYEGLLAKSAEESPKGGRAILHAPRTHQGHRRCDAADARRYPVRPGGRDFRLLNHGARLRHPSARQRPRRAGDFDAAVGELNLVVENHRSPLAKLFLAMAHHRLAHPKAAKEWYARASRAVEQFRQGSEPPPWQLRLCWQHLVAEEAEALLQTAPQP